MLAINFPECNIIFIFSGSMRPAVKISKSSKVWVSPRNITRPNGYNFIWDAFVSDLETGFSPFSADRVGIAARETRVLVVSSEFWAEIIKVRPFIIPHFPLIKFTFFNVKTELRGENTMVWCTNRRYCGYIFTKVRNVRNNLIKTSRWQDSNACRLVNMCG